MYCHSCGVQLLQALSYCNRCGARLKIPSSIDGSGSVERARDNIIWSIVGTTITLLGMSLGTLVLIKNGSIDEPLGHVFVVLSFVAFVLVEGLLLWRLVSLSNVAKRIDQEYRSDEFRTEGLHGSPAAELSPPPNSIGSVTEQTTRSFDKAYKAGE